MKNIKLFFKDKSLISYDILNKKYQNKKSIINLLKSIFKN